MPNSSHDYQRNPEASNGGERAARAVMAIRNRNNRLTFPDREAGGSERNGRITPSKQIMNAASFAERPLGRALLHAACICRHPAGGRFFLTGLWRNLAEWCSRGPPPRL